MIRRFTLNISWFLSTLKSTPGPFGVSSGLQTLAKTPGIKPARRKPDNQTRAVGRAAPACRSPSSIRPDRRYRPRGSTRVHWKTPIRGTSWVPSLSGTGRSYEVAGKKAWVTPNLDSLGQIPHRTAYNAGCWTRPQLVSSQLLPR